MMTWSKMIAVLEGKV